MNRKPRHTSLRRFLGLALGLALVAQVSVAAAANPSTYKVHNIDVGQGSATLIQTLGGKNILVDTGWDFAGDRLVSYLKNKAKIKKIDALVITHRHMDHIGGVKKVAEAFGITKVIGPWKKTGIPMSAMAHLAHCRKDLRSGKTTANRPAYEGAVKGKTFDFGGGFKMEALWPPVATSGKRVGDFNEESVTLRITQKARKGSKQATFLVGGDLGVREERWLARNMPGKLKSDWIIANHHGSAGSSQREFLVAQAGGYSPMLKALINGDKSSDVAKLAKKLKDMGRGKLAGTLMQQVNPLMKKPEKINATWLKKVAKDIQGMAKPNTDKGRVAVYSVGPNAYGHPNATRMSEALLAGFTPITTWNTGSVVMSRKLDSKGEWAGEWKPSAVSNQGLPKVIVPRWLLHRDPDKPYDGGRRDGNYQWALKNPHPEVSWTANWDPKNTYHKVSRQLAKGRKDWVEQYAAVYNDAQNGTKNGVEPANATERAANKRSAKAKLARMKYSGKNNWHGLKLDSMKEFTRDQLKNTAAGRRAARNGTGPKLDPIADTHTKGSAKKPAKSNTAKTTTPRRTRTTQRARGAQQQQRRQWQRTRTRTRRR